MDKILELRQKRAGIVAQMRSVLDTADAEKRSLTAEERASYDKMDADVDDIGNQITTEEGLRSRESALLEGTSRMVGAPEPGAGDGDGNEERALAFRNYIQRGMRHLTESEVRALSVGSDVDGGFLVAPTQIVSGFLKAMDNATFMRGLATTHQVTSAQSLGVVTLESDPSDPDWTAEIATGSEDSSFGLGGRALYPHPLAKRIKMSKTLLRLAPNAESMVMDRLAYKFATAAENAYLNGDGIDKPLGVFTASPFGIATARDVSTDNTATAITADGLINAKYSLKPQYKSLNWIFHRDAIKMIRKLKDSYGQYIWQPSLVAADPDRILDIPFVMSEYAPNTFTTGNYVGILGDFSYYWIADALDMAVQVLTELYAEKNQNGYIGRLESDGMPVMSEAFARVKLA